MPEVVNFPQSNLLFERGDQVELALHLIAEDEYDTDERPRTDAAGVYHVFDPESGLWQAQDERAMQCRIDHFAGAEVATAKEPRPLKLKANDAPAILDVMRRHTWSPEFFRDDLIAFNNGMVARVTPFGLTVEPLRADHGARIMLPVPYDPDWKMPDGTLLERYLLSTFPDSDDQFSALELFGSALMGLGTRYKKAFFLTDGPDVEGQGGTGKSQLLEMLEGLVPKSRRCAIPPQEFANEYYAAHLLGKTLNLVYEAPDTDIIREEGVKAIIHGETVTRRFIRQDTITFRPMALHVFSVNRLPDAPGASGAFWDRWRVIEFNRRFRDTGDAIDEIGKKIVADELENLVRLALRGAERLIQNGGYVTSATSADALRNWRTSADPVACFVAEMCEPVTSTAPVAWITSARLYDAYRQWCSSRGHSPCSMQKFGRRMPSDVEKTRSGGASRYRLDLIGM